MKKKVLKNLEQPGAGSDHASFIFYAGVPVIDTTFDPVTRFPPGPML
jgi:hypothetical protein